MGVGGGGGGAGADEGAGIVVIVVIMQVQVPVQVQVKVMLLMLNINYCCGLFTDYISTRAPYSRVRSTLVPSVACQTTEGEYHSTHHFLPTNTL